MRSFIADEPFHPVEKQHPAPPGSTTLTVRQQKLGLLLIAVIFVAIGIWVGLFIDDPGSLSYGLAFCAVGALALYVSRIPWSEAGRPKMSDTASRRILGGASLVLLFMAVQSVENHGVLGAFWIELAALGCTALFVYKEAGTYQDRRIAKLMRDSAAAVPATPPVPAAAPSAAATSNDPIRPTLRAPGGLARQAPAIRLDVYLQDELPELPGRYRTPVAPDVNIIGLPPRRILYLYNFFSVEALMHKVKGNWRRFGPVYFLGSPGDFSFGHAFDQRIGTQIETAILPTPESFDSRLKGTTDTVLPPGDDSLKGVSHFSGGYPHHLFLCNDGSWRHAVDQLLHHVDLVMIDACGYDANRAGLNWEIGQLLDRKALRSMVVLIDADTDQPALCAAFRAAWPSMATTSPNNTTDPGPVRWVLLERPEGRAALKEAPALPAEADPLGLYPECNPLIRTHAAGNYRDALLEDRIFGLFAEAGAKTDLA